MRISPVSMANPVGQITKIGSSPDKPAVGSTGTTVPSFKDTIKNTISEVNSMQNNADKLAVKLATGDVEDVHKAMIAMQKAKLAFDFTVQVRNKVIEAYQEVMRMQV